MWCDAAASDEVAPGGVLAVQVSGTDLVLWRAGSGRLSVCEQRCPHQWADLGSVGAVDGEELVCLSHFWRFALDGSGSKLSAAGRRDEKSSIEVRTVRERGGRIEIEMNVP